jgi:rhodanese-related sulfurtransferase
MAQLVEFTLRHPLLVGATVVAIIALIAYEIRLRSQAGVSVGAQQAVRLINQGATIVDLRDAEKFADGHIVDAINLTPAELASKPEARLKKKKKPVLLVCDTGASSAKLVNAIRQAGFEDTWALDGGLAGWMRENLPVVPSRAKS